jgi:hypothetical protein
MENVVNPGVLSISTHLEESRSVTTKSADFGVDERERHNQQPKSAGIDNQIARSVPIVN